GLARQVDRRGPAPVAGEPVDDERGDEVAILGQAVVPVRLLSRRGAGVAGGHRVDDHQVRVLEDRLVVVEQLVRGAAGAPASPDSTRRGPSRPRCSHTVEAPGPPLNANITGRGASSVPGTT